MNKLTILIIMVISFGLIATQAMAGGDLSVSDFFYSESIGNTVEEIKATDIHEGSDVSTLSIELSASEFFYGDTIANQLELAGEAGDEIKQLSGQRIQVMGTVMEEGGKQDIEEQDYIINEKLPEIEY